MIPYSAVDAIDAMHMWYDATEKVRLSRQQGALLPSLIVLIVALIPWAISALLLTS